MAIPLTLTQFNETAEPILNEVFFSGFWARMNQGMSVLPLYGTRDPGNKRYAYTLGFGNLGRFDEREDGKPVNMDEVEQLFKKTFTMVTYNKVVPLDENLVKDQEYLQIRDIVDELGMAAGQTRREDAASVFNNAFSTSYLGADSKALCASDHPLDKDGSITGDNAGSTALSYDAVVSTITEMMLFKNSRNKPAGVVPDTLVVPVALWETAAQITENINESDTTDRNVNAILSKGGMRMVVDPYLDASDSNNWFLLDSVLAQRQLLWWDREAPSFGMDMPTQTDKNYYVGGNMRYDFGWSGWQFIYGHAVS